MTDKYTPEQMKQIEAVMYKHCDSMNPVEDALVELANSESSWMPANRQVYKNPDGKYYRQEEGFKCNPNSRPLTLPEVGKEPVQHLVDALENIKFQAAMGYSDRVLIEVKKAQAKHKELMK